MNIISGDFNNKQIYLIDREKDINIVDFSEKNIDPVIVYNYLNKSVFQSAKDEVKKCLDYISQSQRVQILEEGNHLRIHFSIPKDFNQFISHLENLTKIYGQNIKISFQPNENLQKDDFEKFIKDYGTFISELTLENCDQLFYEDTLKILSKYCPLIEKLSINSNKMKNPNEEDFSHFTHLVKLKLVGCSLKNLPKLHDNLKNLTLWNCTGLKIISTLPKKLEILDINTCGLNKLPESFPDNLRILSLSCEYDLKVLPDFPKTLQKINLHGCISLVSLPNLLNDLEVLDLSGCMGIKKIDSFPKKLRSLDLSMCNGLKNIPELPDSILMLTFIDCEFEKLTSHLPENLQKLNLNGSSKLKELPNFPKGLLEFEFNHCTALKRLPDLPNNLQKLILAHSSIDLENLKNHLPDNLQELILINCNNLISLASFPKKLRLINLDNSTNISQLHSLPKNIQILSLNGCISLKALPRLNEGLQELYINKCSSDMSVPVDHPNSLLKFEDRIRDTELITRPKDANKMIYHLFMSKLFLKNEEFYSGFYFYKTSWFIMEAIKRLHTVILEKNSSIKQERDIVTYLNKTFIPMIEKTYQIHTFPEQRAKRTVQSIIDLDTGENLFIPIGSRTHATSLVVTKQNNSKYRLSHYNTGDGIAEWHPRWKQTNRYQTFYIIEDIALESLINEDSWDIFFKQETDDTVDYIYITMRDVFGKGGIHPSPSKNEEEYQNMQCGGVCSVSSLMTMMRHQVMLNAEGSLSEREAIYKSIKTEFLQTYYNDHAQHINKKISAVLPTVLNKLDAEMVLKSICEDEKIFNKAINDFIQFAKDHEKSYLISHFNPAQVETVWERYSQLRKVSKILCDILFTEPEILKKVQKLDSFKLAFAKCEYRKLIFANIENRLEKHVANKDHDSLIEDLIVFCIATPYFKKGVYEAVKRLGDEIPQPYGKPACTIKFLENLNQYRQNYEYIVSNFIEALILEGKVDLAEWAEKYWGSLLKSS